MRNGNLSPYERLWKLETAVNKLVIDGRRDPEVVIKTLQRIVDEPQARRWFEKDGVVYFSVTSDGVTTNVGVLKGMLFQDNDLITKEIRAEAARRALTEPNAELTRLIREKFTEKEIEAMGLWHIVVMHEPVSDSGGIPGLRRAGRDCFGRWLYECCDGYAFGWFRGLWFAFAVSSAPPDKDKNIATRQGLGCAN